MQSMNGAATLARYGPRGLGVLVCVMLLAALLPASALAAPKGSARNHVVTLAVPNADQVFKPGNRIGRQRIKLRAQRTESVTDRLAQQHGFRARHRFERTAPGFSARLTPSQVAAIASDEKVISIRPARRFKPAAQITPRGIMRIKAGPDGPPQPDVDVDIAILDTGIGPVGGNELNVAGGYNCTGSPGSPGHDKNDWQESNGAGHGTHVAGTAAARDNSIGGVGVAPGARLWSVRVFDGNFGDEATIVCGIQWAISTHDGPAAPLGSQPIEVINMSLQGPRGAIVEQCPGAFDDIIHQAICDAVGVGITVVVAAGNNGSNARGISPAGYDQVITVGALSDFDGLGGGGAASDCPGYWGERDDTYANYSNYGDDVDIVAPGTCVESTTPGNGTATRRMTGTSMASPHVAGAVANYLADHPGTPPAKMAKIVRASGRLDWNPKSDPHWSGPSDQDEPNRVLDANAMTASDNVRVWLYKDGFRVGGKATTRSTRVDVQRVGGYEGQVTLGVNGLPGAVGSTSFKDSGLNGLTGLGTKLSLKLKGKGPEGSYAFDITAQGGGGTPSGSRTMALTVDRTGPTVTNLGTRVRAGRTKLGTNGSAETFVQWDASDALSKVTKVVLQRKIGSRAWKSLGTQNGSSSKVVLKPRQANKFRIVATDSLGNRTTSGATSARLSVRDSDSGLLLQPASGGWKSKPIRKAFDGTLLQANKPAESIATTFSGKAFAIVAPVGPGRGKLRLRVDGGDWREVSLKANKGSHKRVVFGRRVEDGSHQLEIEGFKGQTAIDAILIIR